ncbi:MULTISPECIES: argininosuccinate synthase [Catenuloplanes]|uniref:Argininosuccinate synthase n=1 Tax=Catenuloplanes niger TaxID=587534 RepID=A0AAE3ZXU2_9ACTN|nr:argininosuccinate synthase [Catenuloplanes niger]MDR7326810.1 argininosuccinate synthase [Catenuloplanes niger]
MPERAKKIVLAYSGGLDTSTVLKWLQEDYGAEVIAFIGDLGQPGDLAETAVKAERIGAAKVVVSDLRERFVTDFAFPCMAANALYQGRYPMASSIGRPLLTQELLRIADQEGADAVAHGCSGKGNDQLRFALAAAAIRPGITVMQPLLDWPLQNREDQVAWARRHGIDVPVTADATYSYDESVWGRSIGCGPIEDLSLPLPEDVFTWTVSPRRAPDEPQRVRIGFEQGRPVSLDDEKLDPVTLTIRLNELGGRHGVGRIEHIEDKVVGIKSREIYETPAAVILHHAHQDLEELTLDRDTLEFKRTVAPRYAGLAYAGYWFSPLRRSLAAFAEDTQRYVTGQIEVELYKGNHRIVGRQSDHALYDYALSTYDRQDSFDHEAGRGFTRIATLPDRIAAKVRHTPVG